MKKPFLTYQKISQCLVNNTRFCDDVLNSAGPKNIHALNGLSGWPKVSKEYLAGLNPDYVLVTLEEDTTAKRMNKIKGIKTIFRGINFQL